MKTGSRFITTWGVLLVATLSFFSKPVQAQEKQKTRFLIVFDCSGSMWGQWGGKTKMDAAKEILNRLTDSLSDIPNVEVALRLYGHTAIKGKRDCTDTRLEVPFGQNNKQQIRDVISKIRPAGTTPIAYSLTQAAGDFQGYSTSRNFIILITDGIEECDGDPCAVSRALQERNVVLRPLVVGLDIDDNLVSQLECIGRYFDVKNPADFVEALNQVVTQALNNTTISVNLYNNQKKPIVTNLNMTFSNQKNRQILYNYYHTLNASNLPDTFSIDPSIIYDLEINTVPKITKQNIVLKASKHNLIELNVPIGSLNLKNKGSNYYNLVGLVKDKKTQSTLFAQYFNTTQQYLEGDYQLEILTLPRMIQNISIKEGSSTNILIPEPGNLSLSFVSDVIMSLYVLRGGNQEWVIDIDGSGVQRKQQFYLQPGSYKIVYRDKKSHNTLSTKHIDFSISSGGTRSFTIN